MGILNLQHYCLRQTQHYQDNRSNKTRNQRAQRNPGVTNPLVGTSHPRPPSGPHQNVHLLQHQTPPEEPSCLKRGSFYSSDYLKNKDSSEGNSSDLKQIFVFTC